MLLVTVVAVCAGVLVMCGPGIALLMVLEAVAAIASVACVLHGLRMTDDMPGATCLTLIVSLAPPALIFITMCAVVMYVSP